MKKIALISVASAATLALAPAAFAAPEQRLDIKIGGKTSGVKAGTTKKPVITGVTVSTGTTTPVTDINGDRQTITSAKITMPKGIKLNYKKFPSCDLAAVTAAGSTCAAETPKSQIGDGTAEADVKETGKTSGTLTPFIGKNAQLIIRTEFSAPAVIDENLIGKVSSSGGRYSFSFDVQQKLQEPLTGLYQQLIDFTLDFDKKSVKSGSKKVGLVELTSCPKGGYKFDGEFTFRSGEKVTTSDTVSCKKGK